MTKIANVPVETPPAPKKEMTVDEFARHVETCRKNKTADVIENTSVDHAAILIKNLFLFAAENKQNIKIVSGQLMEDFYTPLAPDIAIALDAGCQVDAITVGRIHNAENNIFFQTLDKHERGSVVSLNREEIDHIPHFVVTGGAYRVEVDDKIKKAFASFNDVDHSLTDALNKIFSDLLTENKAGNGERGRPVRAN